MGCSERTHWPPLALAILVTALLVAAGARGAGAHRSSWTWPYSVLVDRIDGTPVKLHDRRFRISRELVICTGDGRGVRKRGVRRWRHFTCTQTLFRSGVDHDVTFRVHVLGRTRFTITDVRAGPV